LLLAIVVGLAVAACAQMRSTQPAARGSAAEASGASGMGTMGSGPGGMGMMGGPGGMGMMGGAGGQGMMNMDQKTMCDMVDRMNNARTPAEREAIMNERMRTMSPEMREQHWQMMMQQCARMHQAKPQQ